MSQIEAPPSTKLLTEEEAALRGLRTQESYLEKYGFHFTDENYVFRTRKGLDAEIVAEISHIKGEPAWMTEFRLKSYEYFTQKAMPTWGGDMSGIDFDDIYYYVKASHKQNVDNWDELPDEIKQTFDKLGIPEAEQKFLAGSGAQFECLAGETRVYTSRGLVAIRDVQVGDTVFAYDEEQEELIPAPVKATMAKGERQVYRVQVGTRSIRATDNHPFFALNGQTAEWKYLSELQAGDAIAIAKTVAPIPGVNVPHSSTRAGDMLARLACEFEGFAAIDSITPDGITEVYDIEVDGPHNFVAEGLIVHNSEVIYHRVREDLERQGVIFLSMDEGLRQHPELVRKYFGSVIPPSDNKFAALNSAVWSGGSFIYVPKGVHVQMPLQAYFRINTESMGQFERTLIIVDEGSNLHYVEGCTAPIYNKNSLHSAVVEIIVMPDARCRYTTIQNWSNNVYNLVTKRAVAYRNATMEWVDANLGCLAEGSTVTTPQGIKAIEDLAVGDEVLSYDEKAGQLVFRRVMAKKYSGEQAVHTVSVGERQLQVTANHPFYSYTYNSDAPRKSGRYQLAYVRADQLEEAIVPRTSIDYGSPYALVMPDRNTSFESLNQYAGNLVMKREYKSRLHNIEYTNDDIMWMFGYWIGDGDLQITMGKTEGVIRFAKVGFSTPVNDRARNQLMNVMAGVIDAEPTERVDGVHLAWNSKELAEFFQLNGFTGKARNKRLPEWVWSLPESQRLAFVAGYLDADGSVAERKFSLKSVNQGLLQDVASLLVTLGITPRLYTEFSEPKKVIIMGYEATAHGSYRLTFPLDERFDSFISPKLADRSQNARAEAKMQMNRQIGRSNIELGDDVEVVKVQVSEASTDLVPTWDIEVEGTGNFVSQGFIVHNSHLTMKYPAVHLMEEGAHGEVLSIAFAGEGQHQDAGGKIIHHAPNTSSRIISKSISKGGGRASYRGLIRVDKGATNVKSNVVCDALLLDPASRSDTYPYIEIDEKEVTIGHEASVSKIGEEQLFYLQSRGLDEDAANALIVNGFIEPLAKELPMEYSIELRKLIEIQLEGTIG
jgi:Fe-S cluster assembly scaffold protein SufB